MTLTPPPTGLTLDDELLQLARAPQLLVACDYDGTVAPLVADPMRALPHRETAVALRALAALPQTHVAIISGRALRDLAALSRLPAEIHLVGSHGSEFDVDYATQIPPGQQALRDQLGATMTEIAGRYEGAYLEQKPASIAFHYRGMRDGHVEEALAELESGPGAVPGITVRHGKMVCELLVTTTDKGAALDTIRSQVGATSVLFLGDDVTDEAAFARLRGPDVGVKVGDGDSGAHHRVDDPAAVGQVLARLCEERQRWLAGEALVPLESLSLLSDQRTAALVTPDGRLGWMCLPRIDSSAVFAELLGGPSAGTFAISPVDDVGAPVQRYVGDSLVLETRWPNVTVIDYLDCSGGRPLHLAGRTDLLRVVSGTGRIRIEFAPRLDFGRYPTQLEARPGGLEVVGATDLLVLHAPGVDWTIADDGVHQTATAEVDMRSRMEPLVLELRSGTARLDEAGASEAARREETHRYWSEWVAQLSIPSVTPDLVRRSAVTCKALCYGPTGAILAAATTSLPETLGGVRNWDYRYCWLRDGAMTASVLVRLGSISEGMAFLDWLLRVIEGGIESADRLAPLYNVDGQTLPPEADITELAGYGGSRPVRVGNAAEHQVQLDVFGPVVQLVWDLSKAGAPLSSRHWRVVEEMVGAVARRWTEPDNGIWEIRRAPRHHVYSKLMCWLTVDRAITVGTEAFGRERPEWHELRAEIAADIEANGWSDESGSFTAAYDGTDLDAAVLAMAWSGFVSADDPRLVSTVEAVEAVLRSGDTVHRYLGDDGLPGEEGGFHLMTSWLIDALVTLGRADEAQHLFAALCDCVGPTGMMTEEVDSRNGRALGNVPQAYSHLGLITNALRLEALNGSGTGRD